MDAVYLIELESSDLAGNAADNRSTVLFEIYKTAPVLEKPGDKTANIYRKPVGEELPEAMEFSDNNIKEAVCAVTAYNFNKKDKVVYEVLVEDGTQNKVQGGTVKLPEAYFEKDGMYEIRSTAYDVAGNDSGEKILTHVVMRNTALMAYIPEENLKKFNNTVIRALDFPDISIYVYVANDSGFMVKIGETLLGDTDYIVEDREIVNQVREYKILIPQSYVAKTFIENNQLYDLPVNVLNGDGQLITLGRMVIDNVRPFGEFEPGFESGRGYYGAEDKTVRVIRLSDDIDENRTTVSVDGKDIAFAYDADNKTVTFILGQSPAYGQPMAGHDVRVTLVDTAGIEFALVEVKNVYVGNRFLRYWIFVAAGGTGLTAGAGVAVGRLWRRKRGI